MSYFVDTLQEVLIEHNLTLKNLSQKLFIPTRTIYDLKHFNPTINNALLIVDYFSSSLDYFERKNSVFTCEFTKDYKINFYENLIKEIKDQNLTISKICKEINISPYSFRNWKHGKLPTYENLILISNYLGSSIDGLLGRKYVVNKI